MIMLQISIWKMHHSNLIMHGFSHSHQLNERNYLYIRYNNPLINPHLFTIYDDITISVSTV